MTVQTELDINVHVFDLCICVKNKNGLENILKVYILK